MADQTNPQTVAPANAVRIVGLGASAGGLVALEAFLASVPAASGFAYVIVQHLDPTQHALLAELLQRVTTMRVREAASNMRIEADCVYVIPPNSELRVEAGALQLRPPSEPRGMRLPIDVLFASLAREQGEQAIGVVLSGMGSDGTFGLHAIKASRGLTAAQQPSTAHFDAMPKSAIAAGCVDIVAAAEDLPARILTAAGGATTPAHEAHGVQIEDALTATSHADDEALRRIFATLVRQTRHDFSLYKHSTVHRRIARRMAIHGISTLHGYADYVRDSTQETELLFKEMLIGVTTFFRDAAVWKELQDVTIPALLERNKAGAALRAWIVGCSTGEEAYSLAIVFAEALQQLPPGHQVTLQIFASDVSADAIAIARLGEYPASILTDVSQRRLSSFFNPHGDHYRVAQHLRNQVLFAQHDVLLDPPFTKLDLLFCRNLLIYFDSPLQQRLLPLFHYSLRANGVLLLGSSETVGRFSWLFRPLDARLKLFARQEHRSEAGHNIPPRRVAPPNARTQAHRVTTSPAEADAPMNPHTVQAAADHELLQTHAPPAVVVNADGDIVYISGRTGKYLEPAAGRADWNFYAMVREGLRAPITVAMRSAAHAGEPIQLRGLRIDGSTAGAPLVDVVVQALTTPQVLSGMLMVVFREVAAPLKRPRGRRASSQLEAEHSAELLRSRDEIRALREESGATREALQAANEELQSTNEELQSTNEELTTSKEEMQSMNEELQTINAEMQARLDDLALAQGDMKNLLNSTDIAMLFLDPALNLRRFTDRATKIFNLRDTDIGRPLSDLTTSLQYSALQQDAHETLRTLEFSEKQIQGDDERWFTVRIMPYRRLDNVVDGAVITLVDITATKALEARLRIHS